LQQGCPAPPHIPQVPPPVPVSAQPSGAVQVAFAQQGCPMAPQGWQVLGIPIPPMQRLPA
jgi:hypothetical protein